MSRVLYEHDEIDGYPAAVSAAARMMDSIFLNAQMMGAGSIALRRSAVGLDILFDEHKAGHLPTDVGEQVMRRMTLYSENRDYQGRAPLGNAIRFRIGEVAFVWNCLPRANGLELTLVRAEEPSAPVAAQQGPELL